MSTRTQLDTGLVMVVGHRGGCGRSSLAASLAWLLAGDETKTNAPLLVDFCEAGGASTLGAKGLVPPKPDPTAVASLREGILPHGLDHPYHVVHMPGGHRQPEALDALRGIQEDGNFAPIICDVPLCGGEELTEALRVADLVLVLVPCEAHALRSIGGFLEVLNDHRSRPGRTFAVRAIVTGSGARDPERQEVEKAMRQYLGAILLEAGLVFDEAGERELGTRVIPPSADMATRSSRSLREITSELFGMLSTSRPGEVVRR
jgi:cellulose biosynthesis protein BcsQ